MAQVLATFIAVAGTLLGYQFQRRGYHSTSGNGYSSATAARTRCRVSSDTRSTQHRTGRLRPHLGQGGDLLDPVRGRLLLVPTYRHRRPAARSDRG
ncbi:hypothetical protein [Streptomyces sp. NPDC057557]|uniref:hypothetical protein n=1 Tax=Streptomyces sp. NPDC057557 TaxID=3346167 RepID=UPI00367E6249